MRFQASLRITATVLAERRAPSSAGATTPCTRCAGSGRRDRIGRSESIRSPVGEEVRFDAARQEGRRDVGPREPPERGADRGDGLGAGRGVAVMRVQPGEARLPIVEGVHGEIGALPRHAMHGVEQIARHLDAGRRTLALRHAVRLSPARGKAPWVCADHVLPGGRRARQQGPARDNRARLSHANVPNFRDPPVKSATLRGDRHGPRLGRAALSSCPALARHPGPRPPPPRRRPTRAGRRRWPPRSAPSRDRPPSPTGRSG